MTGGAALLHAAGRAIQQLESPIDDRLRSAAVHAGDETLALAIRRLAAAYGAFVGQTGAQTVLAAQLAAHAAADLRAATGGAG